MRLDRQFGENRAAFEEALAVVFGHGRVLQGPEVAAFEERMAGFFGLDGAAAMGSGTDALVLALKALGLKPGGKVAVTDLSFVASASAIALAGGVPVFVDIEPEYYQADESKLLELVREKKVDGVIAVHLYGQMTELGEIYEAAKKSGVFVIEDAAQALGSTRNGTPPGHCSDATCVSFDPTKVIGAHGSGGMVLSDDPSVVGHIKRLRYHGHAGNRVYAEIGHNSRLPTIQAALLNVKMDREADWKARRREIAARYDEAVSGLDGVQPPAVREGNEHNFHKYVLTVRQGRDALAAKLKEHGIGTAVHYTAPLHTQPCFAGISETTSNMANTIVATTQVLSLPTYPELSDPELDHICSVLRK